jgi:hypothetical protein
VAPIGDVVATSRALAHVPEAIVAKEICNFMATLAAANPGFHKTIRCLFKEKGNKDKSKRGDVVKKKSKKCRSNKSDATGKVVTVA